MTTDHAARVAELVATLDRLGAAPDLGRRSLRRLLADAGIHISTDTLADVAHARRNREPAPAEVTPTRRGPGPMVRAVRRELRGMPQTVRSTASATLVELVAAQFDGGDRAATGRLAALLTDLRRMATAAPDQPAAAADAPPDVLDELKLARMERLRRASHGQ